MNLDQIETKCFILALFIRDDGERFLLGSRAYEFVDSQLHFAANSYQNDIVEAQGNDGVMLAGQVRRGASQAFDGYIGDSTVDRSAIEQYRRDFMKFFRKNHYYKVVYVFPDGSAVQRRNGFIVEAPEVRELYQLFPKYHVSMNFEDINYYVYEEDSEGEEIYGESATLKVATSATGGLIWEESTEAEISGSGSQFILQGTIDGNVLDSVQLKGDTTQQTYSGYQLLQADGYGTEFSDTTFWRSLSSTITSTPLGNGWARFTSASNSSKNIFPYRSTGFDWENSTTYTIICEIGANADTGRLVLMQPSNSADPFDSYSVVYGESSSDVQVSIEFGDNPSPITTVVVATTKNDSTNTIGLRTFFAGTFASGGNVDLRITAIKGDHTSDWQNYIWEPYVGGIPAPNPDYPQTVNTVTGRQVVSISGGGSQSYEVNLGKNLFDKDNPNMIVGYFDSSHNVISTDANNRTIWIPCEPNTVYTVQKLEVANNRGIAYTTTEPQIGTTVYNYQQGAHWTSKTYTTGSDAKYLVIRLWSSAQDTSTLQEMLDSVQIEKGSTASSYAQYFTPIELCKIGDYQDYIYKSGGDWYIHKATNKVILNGTENWTQTSLGIPYTNSITDYALSDNTPVSDYFIGDTNKATASDDLLPDHVGFNIVSTTIRFWVKYLDRWTTGASLATWLTTHPATVYYALRVPTDTQITNADLVAQLEALAGVTTYNNQTVFTVTSENQLAILNVTVVARVGGNVIWDSYGAEWEEGTGGGPTMINVDSIDNVYPVWTVTGPAVNPQISVLTTNTTLSYSGTVTASQELKIDMFNKTATLNGASVVGNVSGDWVYLKSGVNRITYTTNNAEAPDSKIWWQEIVG